MEGLTHPARRPDHSGLLRALIEEAWQRARRRRRIYIAVLALSIAVIGTIAYTALQGHAGSQGGSPAALAPGAQASRFLAGGVHTVRNIIHLDGTRGFTTVIVEYPDRNWKIRQVTEQATGQYARIRGGGSHVERGGHESTWFTRLAGYVTPKGGPRQHVVIKIKGRPSGTFVITPTEPGPIRPDSGTQWSGWLG